jgi:antitoxin component YwqK of YwqJK toxin-antitoxin module
MQTISFYSEILIYCLIGMLILLFVIWRKTRSKNLINGQQGVWVDYGEFMERQIFEEVDDHLIVTREHHWKDVKQIKSIEKYIADLDGTNMVRNGKTQVYYKNGHLEYEVNYEKGVVVDKMVTFYHDNGAIKRKISHEYNLPHGEVIDFYKNGNVYKTQFMEYGDLNGEWKSYYEDGKVLGVGNQKKGLWDGLIAEYHPNGNKKLESNFILNVATYEKKYHPNGILEYHVEFRDGKAMNDVSIYDEKGDFVKRVPFETII